MKSVQTITVLIASIITLAGCTGGIKVTQTAGVTKLPSSIKRIGIVGTNPSMWQGGKRPTDRQISWGSWVRDDKMGIEYLVSSLNNISGKQSVGIEWIDDSASSVDDAARGADALLVLKNFDFERTYKVANLANRATGVSMVGVNMRYIKYIIEGDVIDSRTRKVVTNVSYKVNGSPGYGPRWDERVPKLFDKTATRIIQDLLK